MHERSRGDPSTFGGHRRPEEEPVENHHIGWPGAQDLGELPRGLWQRFNHCPIPQPNCGAQRRFRSPISHQIGLGPCQVEFRGGSFDFDHWLRPFALHALGLPGGPIRGPDDLFPPRSGSLPAVAERSR